MMGPTHRLVGASTGVVGGTAAGLGLRDMAVVAGTAWLFSRWPDTREIIRVGSPWPRFNHGRVEWRWRWWKRWRVFRHRGPTHWPETWLAQSVVAGVAGMIWLGALGVLLAAGFAIGVGMHLVADACTKTGVEVRSLGHELSWGEVRVRRVWLLPSWFRFRTDGRVEWLCALAGLAAVAGFVWVAYSPMLLAT